MKQIRTNYAMVDRLLAVHARATPEQRDGGAAWYHNTRDSCLELAYQTGVSFEAVVGVVAALSPGSNWERNMEDAKSVIGAFVKGLELPMVGTYGRANVIKASRILSGELPLDVLGGGKVRAFYANILDPSDPSDSGPVTIDRHANGAASGLRGEDASFVSPWRMRYLAHQYRVAARRIGMVPSAFQAVVWVVWRSGE